MNLLASEIPFDMFVRETPLCQFLPQQERIEAWIRSVLLPSLEREDQSSRWWTLVKDKSITENFALQNRGCNVHSTHLLAYMRSQTEALPVVEEPSYVFVQRDSSVDDEELLLQQCIQCNELDWQGLNTTWAQRFPYSFEYLANLLVVYHQPLKLLSLLSLPEIYSVFENVVSSPSEAIMDASETRSVAREGSTLDEDHEVPTLASRALFRLTQTLLSLESWNFVSCVRTHRRCCSVLSHLDQVYGTWLLYPSLEHHSWIR